MSDDDSTVKLVPDCIDKPVKSMLNPLAKEIGSTLSDLLFLITGRLHFKVQNSKLNMTTISKYSEQALMKK